MIDNGLIMQCFEWYMKSEPALWASLKKDAEKLHKVGVKRVHLKACRAVKDGADKGHSKYASPVQDEPFFVQFILKQRDDHACNKNRDQTAQEHIDTA